jgi:pilus assembly protein CpaF
MIAQPLPAQPLPAQPLPAQRLGAQPLLAQPVVAQPSPAQSAARAREQAVASGVAERVRQQFAADSVPPTPAALVAAVRREPGAAVLGDATVLRIADLVRDDLVGAGPLAPLLADPDVTDVLVNGGQVWVDRGRGLQRAEIGMGDPDDVRRLAQRLAAGCGRRLDDGQPYADARLPDGTRLHAVLPPVAADGPYLSLRTFRQRPFRLDELIAHGTVAPAAGPVLSAVVEARLAYLVTGGTGSGKTTLLGTLLGLVPPTERIVLVEDAAELRPTHPHVVALQARTANVEGAGAVGLTDLVRQALRMRPDRLVVGECRGAEIVDLLGALNTGHEGGAGTLHANTPADVPARLEALGMLGGLPRAALHAQAVAALQVVLHVRRTPRGRLLDSVGVLMPAGHERLATVVPAWRHDRGPGPAAEALARLLAARGVPVPSALTRAAPPAGSGAAGSPASASAGAASVRGAPARAASVGGAPVGAASGPPVVSPGSALRGGAPAPLRSAERRPGAHRAGSAWADLIDSVPSGAGPARFETRRAMPERRAPLASVWVDRPGTRS